MLLPELGTNGVRTEQPNHRIPPQKPFDGRFGAGHHSDRFCNERVVCKSERRDTSSWRSRNCSCVLRSGQTQKNRLAQLQWVPSGILSCPSWSFKFFMPSQQENMDRSLETEYWNKITKFLHLKYSPDFQNSCFSAFWIFCPISSSKPPCYLRIRYSK